VAFVWKNAEGWPVEYVSSNVQALFGWNKDDFLTCRIDYAQVVHPEDLQRVTEEVRRYSADKTAGRVIHAPYRIVARDGSVKWVEDLTTIFRDEDGGVVAYEGILLDITEQKLAERERLANLTYFESMERVNRAIQGETRDLDVCMEKVLDVCLSVFQCDRAFLVYPCDPEAQFWHVAMEKTRPEYPGPHPPEQMIPMDSNASGDLRIALETDGPVVFNPETDCPPSEEFWEAHHGFLTQMTLALRAKVGKPWLFGLHQCSRLRKWEPDEKRLFHEIGRRLEEALTRLLMDRDTWKREKLLSNILDNIPDMILVKEADSLRFVNINRAGEKLLGSSKEEVIGKTVHDLLPEDLARRYDESDREVLDNGVPVDIPEENIRNKDGEPRIIHSQKIPISDETGKLQHLLVIGEDITDYKRLQEQLNQSQKMEALGTMSGGIAHDFNNILQPMLGYCEFLKEDLPVDSPQQAFVEGIFKSGLRAKDLVNQILAFSRQSDRKMIPVELPLVVKEAVKLCRSIISSNINISVNIQKGCASILADPTQLHQIIMNLMVNAYHAMEHAGGKITVELKEIEFGEDDLKVVSLGPGRYVRLSISDTGCGMAPAVQKKIFEPYFTTKPQGKGTGLGLAVVYGIVREHGGHINVYSEVDRGTTFNVYLPSADEASGTEPMEKFRMARSTGYEHILLVDDEEVIIQLESQMLGRLGYRVTSCSNGAEALAVFSENPESFDLVITDMNMPTMTGDQLVKELIRIRPDIAIIICTGFSEKISGDEAKAIGVKEFIMKPVAISEMSRTVRKVLDGR
jgi:PAS domain S-box-containing protein